MEQPITSKEQQATSTEPNISRKQLSRNIQERKEKMTPVNTSKERVLRSNDSTHVPPLHLHWYPTQDPYPVLACHKPLLHPALILGAPLHPFPSNQCPSVPTPLSFHVSKQPHRWRCPCKCVQPKDPLKQLSSAQERAREKKKKTPTVFFCYQQLIETVIQSKRPQLQAELNQEILENSKNPSNALCIWRPRDTTVCRSSSKDYGEMANHVETKC